MSDDREGQAARDDREEREYKAAMRRLKLFERRLKLGAASLFVVVPFLYVIGAAVAEGFGAHPGKLPWRMLVPFIVCGLALIFNLNLKEVLVLFGGFGTGLARIMLAVGKAATETAAKPPADTEEGAE